MEDRHEKVFQLQTDTAVLKDCTKFPAITAKRLRNAALWLILASGLLLLGATNLIREHRVPTLSSPRETYTNWQTIRPSSALQWHTCYDGAIECARLEVPLDWLSPSSKSGVVLALARLRANISQDDPDYRGSVIFNPGGPGGSGIWSLRDHGALLQTIVGANHDIVTFDPRGIGASTPRIDCWGGDDVRRALWALQEPVVIDEIRQTALSDIVTRAKAFSARCQQEMSGEESILAHLSTASHARDMLEIMKQMGQEKLKFWGFSYGTVLGGTFASMYPDRVERLVSDGNVDYREWHQGEHINFLRDTDKVMDAFYEYCSIVCPHKCAVYEDNAAAIKARVERLLETMKTQSIIVPAAAEVNTDGPEMPFIVTWSRLKKAISSVLYRPIEKFEPFARILAALEEGDGWPFWHFFHIEDMLPSSICPVGSPPPGSPPVDMPEDTDDAFPAIMCADAKPFNQSLDKLGEYAGQLQQISHSAGAVNILFKAACAGRTVRPKWRYSGPFEGETSFPILYVANMADNVTPLISARNNSAGFPGSVILVQNSYGHTSLATPSTCTAKHINAYFQEGLLPPPDTECEPDIAPFGASVPGSQGADGSELSLAIHKLSQVTNIGVGSIGR